MSHPVEVMHIHHAIPLGDWGPPRFTRIEIDENLEDDDLRFVPQQYEEDAKKLASLLLRTLPGGTVDHLLIELLQASASRLAIPHSNPYKKRPEGWPSS